MILKKGLLASAIGLVICANFSMAAEKPAFSLEVVSESTTTYAKGPFALDMTDGVTPKIATIEYKNDAYTYYNVPAFKIDFGQPFTYFKDCGDTYSGKICELYWGTTGALEFRKNYVYQVNQIGSNIDGVFTDTDEFVVKKIGQNGEAVGYKVDASTVGIWANKSVDGIAKFNGKTFVLRSPVDDYSSNNKLIGRYAKALNYYILDSGKILVTGFSHYLGFEDRGYFNYCYDYVSTDYGDGNRYQLYCDAYRTQATVWLIDPNTEADGAIIKGFQPKDYLDASLDEDDNVTAGITQIVKQNGKYYALGYSVTDDRWSYGKASNVAVLWNLTIDEDQNTVTFDTAKEIQSLERPGNGDYDNLYSWIVGANKKGVILANRMLDKAESSSFAMNLVISKFKEDGTTESASYPLRNRVAKGFSSEGASINDNNWVVGWTDWRDDVNIPSVGGNPRAREGMLYQVDLDKWYRLNDLICFTNESKTTDCSINGKYYYIDHAVSINDQNYILATAFEYPSLDDWNNMRNAKIVTVLLKPNEGAITTATETEIQDINSEYVVTYSREVPVAYSKKSGRGDIDLFMLISLCGLGVAFRRVRKTK